MKEGTFADTRTQICQIIKELYNKNGFLLEGDCLNEKEKADFQKISADMENYLAAGSLNAMSWYLSRYYGKKVIMIPAERIRKYSFAFRGKEVLIGTHTA